MKRLLNILFPLLFIPMFTNGQIFSQYVDTEVGSQPKVIELYNNSGSIIYMGNDNVRIYYAANSGSESLATTIQTGQWKPGQVLIIGPKTTDKQNNSNSDEVTLGTFGAQFQALITERNPDAIYKERTWYWNGNDKLKLALYNVASDTETIYDYLGKGPVGTSSYASWSGVRSQDQNIQRKPGKNIGDTDYLDATQSNASNISLTWETVFDGYGEADGDMLVTATDVNGNGICDNIETYMQGFGIPPVGYLAGSGNIYTWDDTNKKVVNNISGDDDYSADAEPTASTNKPLFVGTLPL